MNKAKLIEALNMTIESLNMVLEALGAEDSAEETAVTEAAEPKKTVKTAKTAKKTPAVKKSAKEDDSEEETGAEETTSAGDKSLEEVKKMGYNDLKKYAQSIGIKAVGTRDQIIAKVEEALRNGSSSDGDDESSGEENSGKVVPIGKKSSKGGLKKKAEPEAEPEEDDEIAKAVRAEAEDMDVTEIAELLQSVGIKASGKKEKLITALIGAVKDGKIDFSDGEEESGDDEATETEAGDEVDFHEYHEDYDPSGLNDPSTIKKKRAKAISTMIDEEVDKIQSGETSEKDIKDFLNTVLTEGELEDYGIDSMDETELVFLYLEVMKSFIDDDGDIHEPSDPYTIGGTNICCGHILAYDDESGQYICESCGETYED